MGRRVPLDGCLQSRVVEVGKPQIGAVGAADGIFLQVVFSLPFGQVLSVTDTGDAYLALSVQVINAGSLPDSSVTGTRQRGTR